MVRRKKTVKVDTRLSYSSAELLSNCSKKYWHRKVNETKVDTDTEDDKLALKIGGTFHSVLERCHHDKKPSLALIKECCKENEIEDQQALVHAMVLKYRKLHRKSGLKCVATEFEISNDIFLGYIDAVFKDESGGWWISDLKTASSISETKIARLHQDTQLNLYANFAEKIGELYKLDPAKFLGVRYRITTKPRLKPLREERYVSYVERLMNSARSIDVVVPVEVLSPFEAYKRHKKLHGMSMKLRRGAASPMENFSYCDSYFKPCEYWSSCHGETYSKLQTKLERLDADA